MTLSDGSLMTPDSRGLYHLDSAHVHLLPGFVAQGWHAPRPKLQMSELERTGRAQTLNTREILELANNERIALKVKDGRLLMRGEPSARLWAYLRGASAVLCDELVRQDGSVWIAV
jgi:hypothetical protein